MTDVTPAKTTRPARVRKSAPTKATQAPVAAVKSPAATASVTVPAPDPAVQRVPLSLRHVSDTKSYTVWKPEDGTGCVGTFYAPLGTKEVRVLLVS